jgi:hypothetical protein
MPHTTCETVAADVYVLALVCVMNSVVVPWLVVALLARRLEAAASMSTSTQPLSRLEAAASMSTCTRRALPPSMSVRFSLSDSALLGNAEGPLSTSNGGTVRVRTRRSTRPAVPPLTMHAAVCSALRRRLSRSDSALLGNAEGPLSTVHGVRTSPSTPTMRPLMPVRTSPVFARMLANTREAPATPRRAYLTPPRHVLQTRSV